MAICGHNVISLISVAKQSLISIHNEVTSLQLLKRCCAVLSCWLQYEHKEVIATNLKLEKLKIQI